MTTESSFALQQSLYTLYRKYYHSGCCVLLNQANFDGGTVRITKGGLYVLTEDIVFNPSEDALSESPYADNPGYSMGYFAAIAVEADDVIIDLQGKTIRQSYEHYARQRFFNVVELASSPFVPNQGPGSLKTATYPYTAASNVLLINGVLGLSSHGGIHGNNNANIMVQNVTVRDFESAGVQLNGVDTCFLDGVQIHGIECAPLASTMFALLRHEKKLQEWNALLPGDSQAPPETVTISRVGDNAGEPDLVLSRVIIGAALSAIVSRLLQAFTAADVAHLSDATPKTVREALRGICAALAALTDTDLVYDAAAAAGDLIPKFAIQTFVAQPIDGVTCPDGSAMYGMIFNSTGVAVGELADVCPANGGACCPVTGNDAHRSDCCRPSKQVTVYNCAVKGLCLHPVEMVGVEVNGKLQRDPSGAVITLNQIYEGVSAGALSAKVPTVFSFARVFVNTQAATPWCTALQQLLVLPEVEPVDLVAQCTDVRAIYNIDIMAHACKGVFGIRAEDTQGLCIEQTRLDTLTNRGQTTCPRAAFLLPPTFPIASFLKKPLNQADDSAFGGGNMTGLFLGECEGVLVSKTSAKTLRTIQGYCRGAELYAVQTGCLHAFETEGLAGGLVTSVYVHDNAKHITTRELVNRDPKDAQPVFEAVLSEVRAACATANANQSSNAAKHAKDLALCKLLRFPVPDALLLAFESPAKTGDVKLC